MNHKMTTTTPFILLGLDSDSFHNDKLMKMFRERGYNILFNSDESHFSSAWYAFYRNKKPTIVVNVWICPYISRHLLSLNPLQARCRRYSRGER